MNNFNELQFDSDGKVTQAPSWATDTLVHFLQVDIQRSPSYCAELLTIISKVRKGDLASWGGVGNAYDLEIGPDGVSLQAEWESDPIEIRLSLAQFETAVASWREYLHKAKVNPDQ
jgi:hypothetical protein